MTNTLRTQLLCLLFATGTDQSMAAETAGTGLCPNEIKAQSVKLVGITSDWTVDVLSSIRWHGATVLGSPPSMKAYLVPETYRKTKKIWADKYEFSEPDADGNWISCSYGEDRIITLSKRLDDRVRECIITYSKAGGKDTLLDATCK